MPFEVAQLVRNLLIGDLLGNVADNVKAGGVSEGRTRCGYFGDAGAKLIEGEALFPGNSAWQVP